MTRFSHVWPTGKNSGFDGEAAPCLMCGTRFAIGDSAWDFEECESYTKALRDEKEYAEKINTWKEMESEIP